MKQEKFDRLKEIRKELLKLEDEITYARSAAEPRAQVLDGMPSGAGGGMENAVVAIDELERRRSDFQSEGMKIIASVSPTRVRRVFRAFYVDALTWEQTAEKLGYSDGATARRVHRKYVREILNMP